MSTRSLNKVMLIGNLTRDPELRYTPAGTPVCTFGIATNRSWTVDGGRKEETEFHRIVAWAKLAELCSKLLYKGRRVYLEGRLQTRQWTGQDNLTRSTTEVVIDDMLLLDSRRDASSAAGQSDYDYQDYGYDNSQTNQASQPPDQALPDQTLQGDQVQPSTNQDSSLPADVANSASPQDQPASTSANDQPSSPKSKPRSRKTPSDDQTASSSPVSDQPDQASSDQDEEQPSGSNDIPF